MALQTLTPPKSPEPGVAKQTSPLFEEIQFGDGYSQRFGRNIVSGMRSEQVPLTFHTLDDTEKNDLETFFLAHQNGEAFLYTYPDDTEGEKKWICPQWTVSKVAHGVWNFSASIKRVFDL